jgi:hypothetical protein
MFRISNPLLAQFWRREVRLTRLHRSSLIWAALALGALIAALQLSLRRAFDEAWLIAAAVALLSVGPAMTLGPMNTLMRQVGRLRTSGQLEPLLVTRLTAWEMTWGLLLPAVLVFWVFWPSAILILAVHHPAFDAISTYSTRFPDEFWLALFGTVPYALIQAFYCAVVALRVAIAFPRKIQAQVNAALILVVAPVGLFFLLLWGLEPVLEFEGFLAIEALLCSAKLVVALWLTGKMSSRFFDLCRFEGS